METIRLRLFIDADEKQDITPYMYNYKAKLLEIRIRVKPISSNRSDLQTNNSSMTILMYTEILGSCFRLSEILNGNFLFAKKLAERM